MAAHGDRREQVQGLIEEQKSVDSISPAFTEKRVCGRRGGEQEEKGNQ